MSEKNLFFAQVREFAYEKVSRDHDNLVETVKAFDMMETFYLDYEIPKDDSVICRFLDLAKFISPQKDRALYLPRPDKFEDQFEGAACPLSDAER